MSLTRACIVVGALIALMSSLSAQAADGQDRAVAAGASLIGTAAPPLTLRTIDGAPIDLRRLYGHKPVYLKFWATWCVPCRQQMPHFEKTYEQRHDELAVIAVNVGFNDTVADVETYRDRLGLKMPIVLDDGRLAAALHLRVTPQHIVIGRDGRILYVGHLVDDHLEKALNAAIAEPAAAPAAALMPAAVRSQAPGESQGPIAALRITTIDGQSMPVVDADARGRTVLAFISPWCESYLAQSRPEQARACRVGRESIDAYLQKAPDARVIGIASGLWADRGDVADYLHAHQLSYPVTVDESGALFRRFDVRRVPTFVVLDAHGHELSRGATLGAPPTS